MMTWHKVLFSHSVRCFMVLLLALVTMQLAAPKTKAQDTVTGAFEGQVTDARTGAPVAGAVVQFINQLTGIPVARRSDASGRFYQGLLSPGIYTIRVSAPNYQVFEKRELRLVATLKNQVVPVPVTLVPETAVAIATPTPVPTGSPLPTASPTQSPSTTQANAGNTPPETPNILSEINTTDARRGGAFTDEEVSTLPLGSRTLVRTFDDLALLLPGVAAPPQTIGNGTGPGVGGGVGTSGQFSVNGLRSRANNFTVDGSDNNDEDIGVRRQGFFALVPQPVESIQEFQVTTLLAPAQYGRNIGAQVNAVSKSGGNETHGTIFGFFNSNQLNAPNAFDSTGGSTQRPLTGRLRNPDGTLGPPRNVFLLGGSQLFVRNTPADKEDSFTLAQGGFVLGGPLIPNKLFYFISAEGQLLNATKEVNFAVPTVEQRGFFNSGATGLGSDVMATPNPLPGPITPPMIPVGGQFPTSLEGDAVFSLFPFPNNPTGVYGANTFTQELPAGAQGKVVSGKLNYAFNFMGKKQDFTARYNFTEDWRDIPATGGAIFSRLRPRVRTQNLSTFLNSELSDPSSSQPIYNQLRLSYGRTHLRFDEGRDPSLLPTTRRFNNAEDAQFLLNAPLVANLTLPGDPNAFYGIAPGITTETFIGPVGQVDIAGFSPVGVDVFNFPQRRTNNTYQAADIVTWRRGNHNFAFGVDLRRTELNSDLPRNSRPLLTFNGSPRYVCTAVSAGRCTNFRLPTAAEGVPYIAPQDFAALSAPSGFFQSVVLAGRDSHINLRYYQLNFFIQDEWRIRRNFSLSVGLRYEYNTPPREVNNRIESTFSTSIPNTNPAIGGLPSFIAGRDQIFDPDKNNFAPRIGFAYSPNWFGPERTTVIRAGYGLYYDQALGAVVSQSRNVFPTFSTLNFGGGCCNIGGTIAGDGFNIFNPITTNLGATPIIQPGTLNTLNPGITQQQIVTAVYLSFPSVLGTPFGATLPSKRFDMPMAHQFSATFEQQLSRGMVISAAYVGTRGRHLLRYATPNLGPNYLLVPLFYLPGGGNGTLSGFTLDPGSLSPSGGLTPGRPVPNVGPINRFETTADSSYDALQLQARGRYTRMQYQFAYTYSKTTDDVSDVFDLAGASALPQNSRTFAGERGPSNFDARHRFSYNFIYDLPEYKDRSGAFRLLFGGWQVASSGFFHTGQPFTVNSIYDVNLDGNLTDRLNTTTGIRETGDRSHPLELTTANTFSLLAPVGQDGSIPRNSFRAGNVLELDLSFVKRFAVTESKSLTFRMDIFNFPDRANYGIPVRFLESPGFGSATDTVTPGRRIQFALKFSF